MLKKYFILAVFISFSLPSFSQGYHIYNAIPVRKFTNGATDGQVKLGENESNSYGPNSISFDKDGNLFICDTGNARVIEFSPNFQFKKATKNLYISGTEHLEMDDAGNLIGYFNSSGAVKTNKSGELLFSFSLEHDGNLLGKIMEDGLEIINNDVFIFLKDNTVLIKSNATENKEMFYTDKSLFNLDRIQNDNDIKAMQKRGLDGIISGLQMDKKSRLFYNGKLVNKDYKVFISNLKDKQQELGLKKAKKSNVNIPPEQFENLDLFLIGYDKDNNSYWSAGTKSIIIFDNEGFIIDVFIIKDINPKTRPAIHPDGEVYFLDYDKTEARLYKVTRVW